MTDISQSPDPQSVPLRPVELITPTDDHMTPAGLQDRRDLARRRAVFTVLNLVTLSALTWGIAMAFSAGGWSISDIVILICFLIGAPWTVMGMWNAVIGLWLLHGRRTGMAKVAPHLAAMENKGPLTTRTALAMTVRNEDPLRSYERLVEMRRSLDATGHGHHFDIFILSDTSDAEIASEEARLFAQMRSALGGGRATYRRREVNTAFKAGNVRDFLQNQGRDFDFYLPLDSDSVMSGMVIVRMVRVMEAYPRLGILQSLVVGTPANSAFARIFQFGMRHGMRSYTTGATWWQGDCGPYWGHNALVRVAPFRRHCRLPVLPGRPPLGGHVLSHDQLEAAFMRRAGYEVRVMPVETESWEDNPPTLMDFTQRDLRWCQDAVLAPSGGQGTETDFAFPDLRRDHDVFWCACMDAHDTRSRLKDGGWRPRWHRFRVRNCDVLHHVRSLAGTQGTGNDRHPTHAWWYPQVWRNRSLPGERVDRGGIFYPDGAGCGGTLRGESILH
jgi:membrane glycosyltransferase